MKLRSTTVSVSTQLRCTQGESLVKCCFQVKAGGEINVKVAIGPSEKIIVYASLQPDHALMARSRRQLLNRDLRLGTEFSADTADSPVYDGRARTPDQARKCTDDHM